MYKIEIQLQGKLLSVFLQGVEKRFLPLRKVRAYLVPRKDISNGFRLISYNNVSKKEQEDWKFQRVDQRTYYIEPVEESEHGYLITVSD
jgi:hypothetical protein